MSNSSVVAILGGGLGGLSAAHYLLEKLSKLSSLKKVNKIYLFEAQSRFGGWIHTHRLGKSREDYFELGPRTISINSAAGVNAIALAESLGLSNQIKHVPKTSSTFKKRYVYVDGRLRCLPTKFLDLLKPDPPFAPLFLYMVQEIFKKPLESERDFSVDQFFRHRFGPKVADNLVNALCLGITGGDSKSLSMRSMFPTILEKEQRHGSVVRGMFQAKPEDIWHEIRHKNNSLIQTAIDEKWAVFSFKNGLQSLPEALKSNLERSSSVQFLPSSKIKKLEIDSSGKVRINFECTDTGLIKTEKLLVDHVFSSIPSLSLAETIDDQNLKHILLSIPTVHMGVVCFEFSNAQIIKNEGFGFLVPSNQNSPILGTTYDSLIFPEPNVNSTKMTVMLGGYRFKDLFGDPDKADQKQIMQIALKTLKQYLNFDEEPVRVHVAIHKNCIAQYNVGHKVLIENLEQKIENVFHGKVSLLGASYRGFSVPDVITNSKKQIDDWWLKNQEPNFK